MHLVTEKLSKQKTGIPCAFEQYEIYQDGEWKTAYRSVPSDKDRIRYYQ